jgi:hypothetical protein
MMTELASVAKIMGALGANNTRVARQLGHQHLGVRDGDAK